MKDIYRNMNRQNILNFYGSKLDLRLDSSELYDFELSKTQGDYSVEVIDIDNPIVYSTLIINTNLTDFTCNRTTITLTEYDNRVNNASYPYSGLTTTVSYSGFTNFISNYHKRIILNIINHIYSHYYSWAICAGHHHQEPAGVCESPDDFAPEGCNREPSSAASTARLASTKPGESRSRGRGRGIGISAKTRPGRGCITTARSASAAASSTSWVTSTRVGWLASHRARR